MFNIIHNLHNNNRYRNAAYHKIEIHIFDILGGLRRLSRSERLNIAASAECKRGYRSSHALGKLSEKRIFPAIDIVKSGTRREDLLLNKEELEAVDIMRKALNGLKTDEAAERILDLFVKTRNNDELVKTIIKNHYV